MVPVTLVLLLAAGTWAARTLEPGAQLTQQPADGPARRYARPSVFATHVVPDASYRPLL